MKYTVTYPTTAGQFAGTHQFFTAKARSEFMSKATRLGAPAPTALNKTKG